MKILRTRKNLMSKKKIILIHLVASLLLTLLLLFTSEPLLNKFAAGIHNVGMWIDLMIFGTFGILILATISCLIFLKQKKIIGLIIILVNLFWTWFSLDLLYRYHFTEFNPTFYIPNWILIMNSIFATIGIVIGFKLITKKINIQTALLTDFTLILMGLIIQQIWIKKRWVTTCIINGSGQCYSENPADFPKVRFPFAILVARDPQLNHTPTVGNKLKWQDNNQYY